MNFGGVGEACSTSCEVKQEVLEDVSAVRKGLNRKTSAMPLSHKKKEIREFEEQKIKMDSINDLNHDVCNLLIYRKIHLMNQPHQVGRYLDSVGVPADQMLGEIDRFQNFLRETRELIAQSTEEVSVTSTQLNEQAGASLVNAPVGDVSESSESEDDSSSDEIDSFVSSNYRGNRNVHKRRCPDGYNAELSHHKLTKKARIQAATAAKTGAKLGSGSKVMTQHSSTSTARQEADPVYADLDSPPSIKVLIDDIQSQTTYLRNSSNSSPDIMTCWAELTSGERSECINSFLCAITSADDAGLTAIHSLQGDLANGEPPITEEEFKKTCKFFGSRVFNGKHVGFTLANLAQLLHLFKKKGQDPYIDSLPPRLAALVYHVKQRSTDYRSAMGMSIGVNEYMEMVRIGPLGTVSAKLIEAMVAEQFRIERINEVIDDLRGIHNEDLSLKDNYKFNRELEFINLEQGLKLKEYFEKYFLNDNQLKNSWLLSGSSDALRKAINRLPRIKVEKP